MNAGHESIADRLWIIRKELGISSLESFGKPLGITKSAASQWFSGKTEPSPDNLFAIENSYGYRARWVQLGELPKKSRDRVPEPFNVSPGPPNTITPKEQTLLGLIRSLTPEQQDHFQEVLEETQRKNKAIFEALSRQLKSKGEGQ